MLQQKQYSLHLEDLDVQYEALQFTQQQAEEAEAQLRQELEALREDGDGQDRQRMVSVYLEFCLVMP